MNGKTSKQLHCLSIPVKNGVKVKTNLRFPPITNNEKLPFQYSGLDSAGSINHKQHTVGLALALLDGQYQWVGMPQIKGAEQM